MQNESTQCQSTKPSVGNEQKPAGVTPVQAVEMLKKSGIIVSLNDAEMILELLHKFANVALENLQTRIRNDEVR